MALAKLDVDGKGQIVVAAPVLPPGVTQADIDASNAANPNAAGANGSLFTATTPMPPQYSGDTTGSTTSDQPQDWSATLGIYGLPPDVQAKVNQIFSSTSDVNQATALALAYIRGTDWYAQTYPGITQGIQNGTVTNEADYRNYVNQMNQLYQQYYGRAPTSEEITGYLQQGYNSQYVGKIFQGQAYVQANRGDIAYTTGAFAPGQGPMSEGDMQALGKEQAGIDTPLGQIQQKILAKASQIQQRIQTGTLATPSLSLGSTGLSSPSLAGPRTGGDVSAT